LYKLLETDNHIGQKELLLIMEEKHLLFTELFRGSPKICE